MEEGKNTSQNQEQQKLTYEKLQGIAGSLQQENKQLYKELEAMRRYISEQQTQSIFAYLESSFKVVSNIELFDTDFASVIIDDIKRVMLALREIIVPKDEDDERADERADQGRKEGNDE